MMIAAFSITPLDKGESVSKYVSQVVKLVVESGLEYRVTAMGTIVEGEPDDVFNLLKKCHMKMRKISNRVSTVIKIDDRKGKKGRLVSKIRSIEKKLGYTLES